MPLPLLLAGAAIIAGGYGVKKGLDAKSDFDAAKRWNDLAKKIYDEATTELEGKRTDAQKSMEQLGKTKYRVYEQSIFPFVEAFSKIKNINFDDKSLDDANKLPAINLDELKDMVRSTLEIKGVLAGGITALGTGGLAGLATFGGVGLLGTASTGTAIGALSGVAATNATLAWLGGGSLAAGGYGMAGGMMVLGGIVAGPVLAIGGMMLASKAEAAKFDAYSNHDKAELAVEQMKSAGVLTDGIRQRFNEINSVISKLDNVFSPMLTSLEVLVESNNDYSSYADKDKVGVMMAASLAKTLKNLIEAPIIDKDGLLTSESRNAIKLGNAAVQQLS